MLGYITCRAGREREHLAVDLRRGEVILLEEGEFGAFGAVQPVDGIVDSPVVAADVEHGPGQDEADGQVQMGRRDAVHRLAEGGGVLVGRLSQARHAQEAHRRYQGDRSLHLVPH